ncbi:lysoplasmalogenase [Pollutibacter soli]|uniref:lysoplasmalogenase n=1 Tax=Pollutibacter soli TaxID=3034157 RepID=UPI003013D20C
MRNSSVWFILFFIDVVIDLFFVFTKNSEGRLFSKTLLMPLLYLAFFYALPRWSTSAFIFSMAIFFSWLGDIMLLFDSKYPILFIVGLSFFLIAHICYIIFFLTIHRTEKPRNGSSKWVALLLTLIYVGMMLYLLWPGLGSLKVPVVIYALTIGLMLVSTLQMGGKLSTDMLYYFISGALLFVISDSILAFNKFRQSFSFASPLIMITYCLAQFFLTVGAIRYHHMIMKTRNWFSSGR